MDDLLVAPARGRRARGSEFDQIPQDLARKARHRMEEPRQRHRADTEVLAVVEQTEILEALDATNTGPLGLAPVYRPRYRKVPSRSLRVAVTTTAMIAVGALGSTGQVMAERVQAADTESNLIVASDERLITDEVEVVSIPAPIVAAESPEPAPPAAEVDSPAPPPAPAPVPPPAPVNPAPIASPAPPSPAPAPAPAPVVPKVPAPPSSGLKAPLISASARAQLGWTQDCTMLATNALANAGIHFHDWPAGYLSLGYVVSASQAVPGDLIYYANGGMNLAHIAVYDGGGMAIHGGWNGNQTVRYSAYIGSGPVFIRVV